MRDRNPTISKFTFDTDFHAGSVNTVNMASAHRRKSYSQDEIDELCAKARDEGMADGQVRAAEALAAAVENMAAALLQTLKASRDEIEDVRSESANLAVAAASKLAAGALRAIPVGEVEAALHETLRQVIGEPRVVLRASAAVAAALEPKLGEIAGEHGYEGRLHITTDPGFEGADCRIEWRGGGAERRLEAIEASIKDVVDRFYSDRGSATRMKG